MVTQNFVQFVLNVSTNGDQVNLVGINFINCRKTIVGNEFINGRNKIALFYRGFIIYFIFVSNFNQVLYLLFIDFVYELNKVVDFLHKEIQITYIHEIYEHLHNNYQYPFIQHQMEIFQSIVLYHNETKHHNYDIFKKFF